MNRTFTLLVPSPGLPKVSLRDHLAHGTDDVTSLSCHIDKGVSDDFDMVSSTMLIRIVIKDGALGVDL